MNITQNIKDESSSYLVRAYLNRIGYTGPLDGSADTLAQLQYCHLHSVPYENFDILRKIPLSLDTHDLFEKIVVRRRGGYCFELNALFGWLLREIGYSVTDLLARFWRNESAPPPKRRHQVLQVIVDNSVYLCDVGVGGIVPRWPLKIINSLEQLQGEECYRLDKDANYGWMLNEQKNGEWRSIYSFTDEPQYAKDFIMPSFWCEKSSDSIFVTNIMVAIRTTEGRNTIHEKEFRIFNKEGVQTFIPDTEIEYNEALKKYFGIVLD